MYNCPICACTLSDMGCDHFECRNCCWNGIIRTSTREEITGRAIEVKNCDIAQEKPQHERLDERR